jgi:GAF domain-containing protein
MPMETQLDAPTREPGKWAAAAAEPAAYARVITAVANHLINLAPDDIDNGINHILGIIGQYTQSERAIVFLQQHNRIYDSYEWCIPSLPPISGEFQNLLMVEGWPWLATLLKHQSLIHIPHIDHLPADAPHERSLMLQYNTRSFIAIRLGPAQNPTGLLILATHTTERAWNQEETSLLQIVAEVFTNAILRKEMEQREMLAYQIGAKLASLLDKDALLHLVSEQLRDTFGYYHTQIFLTNALLTADDETPVSHLIVQASVGIIGSQLKERRHTIPLNASRSIVARAARTRAPIVANDVRQTSFHLPNPILPDTRSEVAIPLINEEALIGVLDVQHIDPDHFGEHEVRTLQIIAHQLSTALDKSALFARNQHLLAELRLLQAVAQVTNEASDEDSLIEQTTKIVAPALHADVFGFSLIDPATGHRTNHPSYLYRYNRPLMPVCGPGEGIGGRVAQNGKPWRIGDVRQEPTFIGDAATRAELCVPILLNQRVIGVINAESPQLNAFTLADERLLLTIAGQIANAIARLRHFREARKQAAETSALLASSKAMSTLDLDHVLKTIAAEARTLFQVDTSHIHLIDPDGKNTALRGGRARGGRRGVDELLHPGGRGHHWPCGPQRGAGDCAKYVIRPARSASAWHAGGGRGGVGSGPAAHSAAGHWGDDGYAEQHNQSVYPGEFALADRLCRHGGGGD